MLEVGKIYNGNGFYVLPLKIISLEDNRKVCQYIGLDYFYKNGEKERKNPVWLTLREGACLFINSFDREINILPDGRYYITSLFEKGLKIN